MQRVPWADVSGAGSSTPFRVRLWTQTTWSGHRLVAPVSDLDKAILGGSAEADAAMRKFLGAYLEEASATVLSRFSLPEPIEVMTVRVVVPRLELPRRLQMEAPLEVRALLIPSGPDLDAPQRDVWVLIPVLDHTFFVSKAEDLEDAIRSEVVRMAAVLKPEPVDYLDLIAPQQEELQTMEVALSTEAGGLADAKVRRARLRRKKLERAQRVLESVGRPLHIAPGFVPGPAPVGMDQLTSRLQGLLTGPARSSVLLVGDRRTGKTELLWSVLRAQPEARAVWATSGAQLIAGMSGLGQWQERVHRVMEAVEALDAVLYFDDVADLFGEQSHGIDLPSAIRPFVQSHRARVVAEATPAQIDRLQDRNTAFFASFHRVRVQGLDRKQAERALENRIEFDRRVDPDGPRVSDEVIQPITALVDRYFGERPYPAKALRLYESLTSLALQTRLPDGRRPEVGPAQVLSAFSLESGIPEFLLRDDEALKEAQILETFGRSLIGQAEAARAVAQTICVVKAALQPSGKPLATFLFVGPTGVGKTELARTLARFLFGSEDRMTRFDMSEFADPMAADRLISGTDQQPGLLTRSVQSQPFSVLLLDEIEKADPSVFDLLLQVCGEGRLTDSRGETTYFHNTIIVMTSNLGAAHRTGAMGFDAVADNDHRYFLTQVERSFRPEFVNRLDRIIAFRPLTRAEVAKVVGLALDKVSQRKGLVDRGVRLSVSPAALDRLAEQGYSPTYGARATRRHIDQVVVSPLANLLAKAGAIAQGGTVQVRLLTEADDRTDRLLGKWVQAGLQFRLVAGQQAMARRDARHAARIGQMRRTVERHLALDRVEQLRSHRQLVRAQLNVGGEGSAKARRKRRAQDPRTRQDLGRLSQEHHQLQEVLEAAEASRDALVAAEEVALIALGSGEETLEIYQEAERAEQDFLKNLAYLLLVQQPARDEVTLMLMPVGPQGAYRLWLVPLLGALAARQWQAELHVAGEPARPGEVWPSTSPWGPPRPPKELIDRMQQGDPQSERHLLLRVRGPYAGALLALEQGLHHFEGRAKGGASPGLFVNLIAMRYTFADEQDWSLDAMAPPSATRVAILGKRKPIRRHRAAYDRLELNRAEATLVLPLGEYWSRFEEVVVAELLAFEANPERDRDALFYGALEGGQEVES